MFLNVFGHSVSIAEKEGDNTPDMRGEIVASFDNNPIDTRGRPLDSFTFTTIQQTEEEAYALASVLAEDWHHFPLRFSFWSDDGIGPEIGITASLVSSTYANITAATWDTELVGPWTVMGFHANSGDPSTHFVVRSDGAKWFNGVRNDGTATTWLSVDATTGALSITTENIKKMVAFHTHISAAMVASWYTFQTSNAWTRHLLCSGSFRDDLATTGKQFLGALTGQTVLRGSRSGTWVETDRSLSFRLDEVP
jgi:hypothetical protein